jgi:hypothetical protein
VADPKDENSVTPGGHDGLGICGVARGGGETTEMRGIAGDGDRLAMLEVTGYTAICSAKNFSDGNRLLHACCSIENASSKFDGGCANTLLNDDDSVDF